MKTVGYDHLPPDQVINYVTQFLCLCSSVCLCLSITVIALYRSEDSALYCVFMLIHPVGVARSDTAQPGTGWRAVSPGRFSTKCRKVGQGL